MTEPPQFIVRCHVSSRVDPDGGRHGPAPSGNILRPNNHYHQGMAVEPGRSDIREGGQRGPVPSHAIAADYNDMGVQLGTAPNAMLQPQGEQRGSVPWGGPMGVHL
eukprot:6123722-Karenia_brevis.AAC.1